MGVYDEDIAAAQEMIAESGQLVTWRKLVDTPNASQPWKPSNAAPVDYLSIPIVFLPVGRVNFEFIRALAGTEVAIGSLQGLMGAVSFEPSIKDVVIRGGKILNIKAIDPLAPNGDVILYTILFDA